MRVHVQTFRVPGWVTPVLLVLALALLPFLLTIALGLLGLVLAATAVRYFLLPSGPNQPHPPISHDREDKIGNSQIIDVDYEVKDEKK